MAGLNTLTALEWVKKHKAHIECDPAGFDVCIYVRGKRWTAFGANLVSAVFALEQDLAEPGGTTLPAGETT